jgi:hypothetical protein
MFLIKRQTEEFLAVFLLAVASMAMQLEGVPWNVFSEDYNGCSGIA